MKKLLVYTIFPAPYRTAIFDELSKEFEITVIFERNSDANRDSNWFQSVFKYKYYFVCDVGSKCLYSVIAKTINEFDLVCFYDYSPLFALKLIHLCKKKRKQYAINCDGTFDNRGILKQLIKKYIISGAELCFASGNAAKRFFLRYGASSKDIIVHNFSSIFEHDIINTPIPEKEKMVFRQKNNIPCDKKTVISVGQFTHRKGYDLLLKAWKNVSENCYLILIGGGEDKREYELLIEELKLERVRILDYLPKDKILEYMKLSDFFILPTREDIWGLVINEALACGLPTITTNRCIAGLEMVNSENGLIIPVENVDSIYNAINNLACKDAEELISMSLNALSIAKEYTIDKMCKVQIEAIKRVI